jgi:hypothetical protein
MPRRPEPGFCLAAIGELFEIHRGGRAPKQIAGGGCLRNVQI